MFWLSPDNEVSEHAEIMHFYIIMKGEDTEFLSHLLSRDTIRIGAVHQSYTLVVSDSDFLKVCCVSAGVALNAKKELREENEYDHGGNVVSGETAHE